MYRAVVQAGDVWNNGHPRLDRATFKTTHVQSKPPSYLFSQNFRSSLLSCTSFPQDSLFFTHARSFQKSPLLPISLILLLLLSPPGTLHILNSNKRNPCQALRSVSSGNKGNFSVLQYSNLVIWRARLLSFL